MEKQNNLKEEALKIMENIDKTLEEHEVEQKQLDVTHYKKRFPELTLSQLYDILSIIIKEDWENKLITFLAMISTYTYDSQLNISFNAPSSSGKTFITKQLAKLIPREDKIELNSASPTALRYREGVIDEDTGATIIDLSRKLLIFYEVPGPEMQKTLRAIMSHDSWENTSLTTNKDKKGANKAQEVIITGYPTTIFCSAGLRLDEQETSRVILLSPEVTEEKLKASIRFTALRNSGDKEFLKGLEDNPEIKKLKRRIIAIKEEGVDDVYIPNIEAVEKRFLKMIGKAKPRHNRDLDHLLKLVKAFTILNVWHRMDGDKIVTSKSDIDQVFELWQKIADSQNQNLPPVLLQFYKHFIVPACEEKMANPLYAEDMKDGKVGLSRDELSVYYRQREEIPLNWGYYYREMQPQLKSSDLIQVRAPEFGDKRSPHIFPQQLSKPNNVGTTPGTEQKETEEPISTEFINSLFGIKEKGEPM